MHQTHRPDRATDTSLSTAPRGSGSWRFPLNKSLVPFALLVLSQSLLAQQPPTAGSQMQQIPAAPVPQKAPPEIRIERGSAPVGPTADEAKILVRNLRVTGAKAYTEAELIAITGFTPGTELTLTDLRAMASKITTHYAKNGYFVARAYLPAQQITDNTVTIEVSEGQYGKIILRNQSTLSDNQAHRLLDGLNSGDPITNDPLESRLLLLSDTPGVNVKSTLVPGATPGTSDLIVDVTPGKSVSGSIDADNAGNRYTGEYRAGATVNLNNPLGLGDQASVRAVTSGSGLNYGRASYQVPFGKTTVGVAYSRLEYELGEEFESLQANGTAEIASVYAIRPLIRSRNTNLYTQLTYEARTFQDRIDSTIPPSVTDRKADVLMASLYGDHRDNLGGGGISAYSLTWSIGNLNIQTPSALAADAASAKTNGSYNKLAFTATRLQRVTNVVSLYGSISGQVASKNLDSSEKMDLGGMTGVRAYPQGEASGDQGYLVNLEARLLLAGLSERVPGQVHLIGFVDAGSVTIHKNPWFTGNNHRNLGAYGVGASWGEPGNFLVRTYYARKLGNEAAISAPDKSGRFWIQAIKYF